MTKAELKKLFAEMDALSTKLEAAYCLHFLHDDGTYYFLPVGEAVEVYYEGDGEPPHFQTKEPRAAARARYRKLLTEGFAASR